MVLRALAGEVGLLIPLCAVSRGVQIPTRNIEKIGSGGSSTGLGLLTVKANGEIGERYALAQVPMLV